MYTSLFNNFQYICDVYITFVSWPPWDVSQLFGRHSDLAARTVVFLRRHQGSLLLFHGARCRRQKQSLAGLFLFLDRNLRQKSRGGAAFFSVVGHSGGLV